MSEDQPKDQKPGTGQNAPPPGMREISYPGLPPGASAVAPIGQGVPQGGWREPTPGSGPGYPPSAHEAALALMNVFTAGFVPSYEGALKQYGSNYYDWLRQ